jgi:hypothetical protein
MRTAPGIGEDASSSIPPSFPQGQDTAPPSSAAERMRQARDARELALSLGLLIFGPSVIFEIAGGLLHLRAMSPHEDCDESPIDLEESCCLTSAVAASRYMGPWYPSEIHDRYNHVFNQGELVRVDRIGTKESGLVVARKVTFDDRDDSKLHSRASRVWDQLSERNTLYG